MQADMVVVTFTDKDGAEMLLKTLNQLVASTALGEPDDVVIVVKDEEGRVNVLETAVFTHPHAAKVSVPGLVVGLMLGGSIANTLLGAAAGTLLAHQIELGIPPEQVNKITRDMIAARSMLFIQGCAYWNGAFGRVCDQSGGKLYDLPMTQQTANEVKIMSSTLDHYWL